jgi:hypothetical protein
MNSEFRPLKTQEREIFEKLLEPDFPGRDELRRQLDLVTAQQVHDDGTLALRCGSCQPAPVRCQVPTEGECSDSDGGEIHVLLHVVNGFMNELEIFKNEVPGGKTEILKPPAARDLVLFTPYGEAGVKWGTGESEAGRR